MNSARVTFAFAVRLISIFFLLLLVAPHSPAQHNESENTSPEPNSVAKAPRNQGPVAGQRPAATSQGSGRLNSGAQGQRGSSSNAAPRQGSSRGAVDDRSSSNDRGGRRDSANNASARSGSGSEAEDGAPNSSNDKPGPRGASASAPARDGSSTETGNGRGASTNGPGQRGSRSSAGRPGSVANADEKNASENGRPDGAKNRPSRVTRSNGSVVERDRNGRTTSVTTPRGTTARMDTRGHVTSIRDKSGNTISRGPGGERKVETVRADRSRVVTLGRRGGYVERPFNRGGRQYVSRTYVVGGHSYVRVYRGHYYHGRPYYVYVPPYYYSPAYYDWMYGPWPRPVYYHWGWYGSIWYRPYGYYFMPYPVYPYASLWLTDYLIAENLRLAYEADQLNSQQPSDRRSAITPAAYHPGGQTTSGSAVLTPEVKQMIADEVKGVIAEQQKAATRPNGASQAGSRDERPAALHPDHRVFVVFSVLEANANGDPCSLTSSDVVKRIEDIPDSDNTLAVQILSSKRGDCAIGSQIRIQLTDLNDMLNHLHEQVDAGMKVLAEQQGKDGLPAAPPVNPRAVPEGTAAPDRAAAADLQKQEEEADQVEKEVGQEASADFGSEN